MYNSLHATANVNNEIIIQVTYGILPLKFARNWTICTSCLLKYMRQRLESWKSQNTHLVVL